VETLGNFEENFQFCTQNYLEVNFKIKPQIPHKNTLNSLHTTFGILWTKNFRRFFANVVLVACIKLSASNEKKAKVVPSLTFRT
jgi:hypothetical protein